MPPLRALCFDLDNTLWDVWPAIQKAERAMYDFLAQRYPKCVANLTVDALREVRDQVAHEFPQMQHDFTFLRKESLRKLARMHAYPDLLVEEAFEVFICARNEVTLYEEALPALQALGRRFRLFSASNGNADLRKIGIAHLFERSVAAREVGFAKPHPQIFHSAIEGTDLTVEEVAYVGDDPVMDVVGARAAGMHPIWVNRIGQDWPAQLERPRHSISTLTELVELLA